MRTWLTKLPVEGQGKREDAYMCRRRGGDAVPDVERGLLAWTAIADGQSTTRR